MEKNPEIARVNTFITIKARQRLDYALSVRKRDQLLGNVTLGMVLSDLLENNLPPSPFEIRADKKARAAGQAQAVAQ